MGVYGLSSNNNTRKMAFEIAEKLLDYGEEPVFLCVGNSNVVGDMYGAMVGDILKDETRLKGRVFGTLNDNVRASNLYDTWAEIKNKFPLSPIVIIDSALTDENQVGYVKFCPYGCIPNATQNNKIMGNLSILAMVNSVGISQLMFLKSVKYTMVKDMAQFTAKSILESLKLYDTIKCNFTKFSSNKTHMSVGY